MADDKTSQAKHLTSVTLDISQFQANLKKMSDELDTVATKAVKDADKIKSSLGGGKRGKTISVDNKGIKEATENMADFGKETEKSTTLLQNFATHLTNRARWMASYAVLDTIATGFSNIGSSIIAAEDAAIELQRVLGSGSPALGNMKEELNDIAYEFGQTFENVQQVAVRFAQTGMDWNETIDATRATMLGLNTAELEVETATNGLIAVMAQFHLQASDLEEVIDKINITADNFPVTSEKIVAALQRAGGTASAYNLTLEETIGLITALSEATGRSGESIGTALNSLISFSMKESSLKTFSGFLGFDVSQGYDVLQIWELLGEKIKGGEEAVAEFMAGSAEFAELFNEQLAEAVGAQDELNLAVENGEAVYSSVGVYRKNYFIALLNNINTAREAMQGMTEATDYSLQENETAMSTLSKKIEQLMASARALAIELGESGVLDFAKTLVDAASATLQLTNNLGGLRVVMGGLLSIMLVLEHQKIAERTEAFKEKIAGLITNSQAAQKAIRAYGSVVTLAGVQTGNTEKKMSALQVRAQGVRAAFSSLTDSVKQYAKSLNLVGKIGLGVGAVTTIVAIGKGIYNAYKQAEEKAAELRQENIKLGKEAGETAKAIAQAWDKYNLAKQIDNTQNLKQAQIDLVEALGYTQDDIDSLIYKYGNLDTAIQEVAKSQYLLTQQNAVQALKDAETEFKKNVPQAFQDIAYSVGDTTSAEIAKIFSKYRLGEIVGSSVSNAFKFDIPKANEAEEWAKNYAMAMAEVQETVGVTTARTSNLYGEMIKGNAVIEEQANTLESARRMYELTDGTYEEFTQKLKKEQAQREASVDLSEEQQKVLAKLNEQLTALGEEYDSLTGKIDSFQSAYSVLTKATDEYSSSGELNIDTIQSLLELEPEYIETLELKNGQLTINKEKIEALEQATKNYLVQQAAVNAAEEYDSTLKTILSQTTDEMAEAEVRAAVASTVLQKSAASVFFELATGKITIDEFRIKLAELGNQGVLTAAQLSVLEGSTEDIVVRLNSMVELIKNANFKISSGASGTGTGTGKTKAEKMLDSLAEKLEVYEHSIFLLEKSGDSADKLVAVYRKMQEEIHAMAQKYRDMGYSENSEYIRKLQEDWWKYQDNITELIKESYEDSIKARQNALALLENQYGILQGSGDYTGAAKNLQKQLNAQIEIQELAHKRAQELRKQGVAENDEAIQQAISDWWSAADEIEAIKENIQESIIEPFDNFIDLADEFDLWDSLDITKFDYLQQKLQAINKVFEQGNMSLKEYNGYLQEMATALYEAKVDSFQSQIDKINQDLENEKAVYEKDIEDWEKRKEKAEEYYDSLIDSLNEVQEDNERINQQLDYYNDRQKVITNLEQAQARSGVEWRQKEMEYQQELIDLDKDWNRTQQDWDIKEQINRLEELKKQATSDIQSTVDSIKSAIEALESEAEQRVNELENQITALGTSIKNAISTGVSDGLVDSEAEMNSAWQRVVEALGGKVSDGKQAVVEGTKQAGTESKTAFDTNLISPAKASVDNLSKYLKDSIVNSATSAAKSAATSFKKNFTEQVQKDMASVNKQAQTATSGAIGKQGAMLAMKGYEQAALNERGVGTIYIQNNVASQAQATSKTNTLLQKTKIK